MKKLLMMTLFITSIFARAEASETTVFTGARLGNYGNVSAQCGLRALSSNSSQLNLQYIHNPESGFECDNPSLLPSTGVIRLVCNAKGDCDSQTFDITRTERSAGGGGYWNVHYKFKVVVHVYDGGEIDFGMKNLSCTDCHLPLSEEVQQFSFKNTDVDLHPSLFVVSAYVNSSNCELAKAVAFMGAYKKCQSNGYLTCREVNTKGEGGPGYCVGTSSFRGF